MWYLWYFTGHACNMNVTFLCFYIIWPADGGTAQGGGTEWAQEETDGFLHTANHWSSEICSWNSSSGSQYPVFRALFVGARLYYCYSWVFMSSPYSLKLLFCLLSSCQTCLGYQSRELMSHSSWFLRSLRASSTWSHLNLWTWLGVILWELASSQEFLLIWRSRFLL